MRMSPIYPLIIYLFGYLTILSNCTATSHNGAKEGNGQRRFADKVVIITGSSSGIGQEAAFQFAAEGAKVVIHGRDMARLKETETKIEKINEKHALNLKHEKRVHSVAGNIQDEEICAKIVNETVATFKKIDILINSHGAVAKADTPMLDLHNLDYLYQVDLRSIVNLTNLALPELIKAKGVILNVSSLASIRPVAMVPFYSAMKAALDQWTRTLAMNIGQHKVRVNAINPGSIENTRLVRDLIPKVPTREEGEAKEEKGQKREGHAGGHQKHYEGEGGHDAEEKHHARHARDVHGAKEGAKSLPTDNKLANMTLLGREGRVDEVASAMKFLCSDEASYITGITLVVDGGMSLKPPKDD